jgi:hypothetical protein
VRSLAPPPRRKHLNLVHRPLAAALLITAPLLPGGSALACSLCACGDPLVAASDSSSDPNALRVGVESEWLTANADVAEDGATGHEKVEQGTLRMVAVYSPVASLNVVVQAPLVWKTTRTTFGAEHATAEQSGLGDVDLGARWFIVDRSDFSAMSHQTVALSAGSSLPTGANRAEAAGVRLDEHAQLGTGAFGPYLGALYGLDRSDWHAFASLTGRYRTENDFGYRYGASLAWTVQAQRQLGSRLAVGLGVDGRWADADRDAGAAVQHTGGLVLAAVPQLSADVGGGVWLSARVQVPFATALRGVQEVGPTFLAGLQYRVF